jgi:hypothetical protein
MMENRSHGETRLIEAPSGAAHHSWPRLRSVAAQIGVGADLRQPPQLETDTTSDELTRWLILFSPAQRATLRAGIRQSATHCSV